MTLAERAGKEPRTCSTEALVWAFNQSQRSATLMPYVCTHLAVVGHGHDDLQAAMSTLRFCSSRLCDLHLYQMGYSLLNHVEKLLMSSSP